MPSTIKSKRYTRGVTDYHHRRKLIKDYQKVVRVYLSKKNNYYLCGIYHTPNPAKADWSYGYYQSRWYKDVQDLPLKNNLTCLELFGNVIGQVLNQKHVKHDFSNKVLILDLGRRKAISYQPFLKGIFSKLDLSLRDIFRASEDLKSQG